MPIPFSPLAVPLAPQTITNAQQLIAGSGGVQCLVDVILSLHGKPIRGSQPTRLLYESIQLGIAMLVGDVASVRAPCTPPPPHFRPYAPVLLALALFAAIISGALCTRPSHLLACLPVLSQVRSLFTQRLSVTASGDALKVVLTLTMTSGSSTERYYV